MRSDAEIQQAVLQELAWDPYIDAPDVGVEVDGGIVTLSGTVASYAKRVAAQEAAHRVGDVRDVANDIAVILPDSPVRTDTAIAQAVRQALTWDVLIPQDRITSTVTDGWVSLGGIVDFAYQRDDAAKALQRLQGVRGVANWIVVITPPVTTASVRAEIEAALERRVERESRHIQVAITDGTVTLSGTARSWPEKQAILGAAHHTVGVRAVVDQLRIDPES